MEEDEKRLVRAGRFRIVQRLAGISMIMLTLRLGFMQLGQHDRFVAMANRNTVDSFATPAPRGTIFDRDMRVLAYDKPSFSLIYTRKSERMQYVVSLLSRALQVSKRSLIQRIASGEAGSVHVLIAAHVPLRVLSLVREHQFELPGVSVVPDSIRIYPRGDTACHVMGYINSIPDSRKREYALAGFPQSTKVGWSGVELSYDRVLRGQPGRICMEVDSRGIPVRMLGSSRAANRGHSIKLTIDADYQDFVQKLLVGQVRYLQRHGHKNVSHAMAVAIEPSTGAVLALASVPTYEPGWFVSGISYRTYSERFAPAERNWATQAPIAPGSAMKPLTALFALSQKVIDPKRIVNCQGDLAVPATDGTKIKCWTRHGSINLAEALSESCDVYFYKASLEYGHWPPGPHEAVGNWLNKTRLGTLRKLERLQQAFGLGSNTGIDLPEEEQGYVNEGSGQVTDLPYTAIGQNEVFTPLELCVYAATLANDGKRIIPHVVDQVAGRRNPVREIAAPLPFGISIADLKAVQWGMYLACNAPLGTAYGTFHAGKRIAYDVAGKTGTAETGVQGFDNAVFIGYAPYVHPRIAVAVVVPGGGHGADSTGPIVRAMLDRFFALSSRKSP